MTGQNATFGNDLNARKIKRVAAYMRVSSEDQVDNWSLDSQLRQIEDYFELKSDFEIVARYREEGHSAYRDKAETRPVYRQLMADAEGGKFDLVVTVSIDRMSRNSRNMIATVETLAKHNVGYMSLAENLDLTGPMGEIMLSVFSVMAQHQSTQISFHVKRALEQRVRSGLGIGRPPYGYVLCDDSCQGPEVEGNHGYCHPDPEKAKIVLDILRRYESGSYSYGELADRLDRQGYRTNGHQADRKGDRPKGYRFTGVTIAQIVSNPFYMGVVVLNGKEYPGAHTPIISEELFRSVERLRKRRSNNNSGRRSKHGHLLAKLVKCYECGQTFHSTTMGSQSGVSYYKMARRSKGPVCRYLNKSFVGTPISDVIDKLFAGFEMRDDWRDYVLTRFTENTNIKELKRRKRSLLRKRDRVNELFFDGEIDRTERDTRVAVIDEELLETEEISDDAVEKAGEFLENFGNLWESASVKEKNRLLRTVLRGVYVDYSRREIVSIEPQEAFKGPLLGMAERADIFLVKFTEAPYGRESDCLGGERTTYR